MKESTVLMIRRCEF